MVCKRCNGSKKFKNNQECIKCGGKGFIDKHDSILFLIAKNPLKKFRLENTNSVIDTKEILNKSFSCSN